MIEPSSHSYLGNNLEYIHNRQILLENEKCDALLFVLPDLVLLPHETLPLRLRAGSPLANSMKMVILTSLSRDWVIGVVNDTVYERRISSEVVGTIAEIRQRSILSDTNNNDEDLVFLLKGTHRFKIVSTNRRDHVLYANIIILPDFNFHYHAMGYLPRNKRRCNTNLSILHNDGRRFPSWVYRVHSPENLVRIAFNLFASSTSTQGTTERQSGSAVTYKNLSIAMNDSLSYSYFLASNLPLSTALKQVALEAEDVMTRLRIMIEYMKLMQRRFLCCSRCHGSIAQRSELFAVPGADGMIGAYVNSHGAVHETITIKRILPSSRVMLQGTPSSEDSWFPGYEWTIAVCGICFNHLGWLFTDPQTSAFNQASVSSIPSSIWPASVTHRFSYYNSSAMSSEYGENTGIRLSQFWGFRRGALCDDIETGGGITIEHVVEDEQEDVIIRMNDEYQEEEGGSDWSPIESEEDDYSTASESMSEIE